jgi:hypothetical protein
MNRRSGRIAAVVLAGVLASPGLAHASLWDLIWKMSGPQMSGIVFHCEWGFGSIESERTRTAKGPVPPDTRSECRAADYRFYGMLKSRKERLVWLSFDTGPYFSTGKNPHGPGTDPDYEFGEVWMVAAEPILEVRSGSFWHDKLLLNHGVLGATYDIFFGGDFDTFDKAGLKFKPVTATFFKKVNASLTARWYPNGTTPDEFGKAPPQPGANRPSEWVYGFSVGYLW